MDLIDECTLLGASLLGAQRLEFALYGVVSHLSHLDEAKKDKRFRELTPEKFLRGSIDNLKATFGQLEKTFGQRLLISDEELLNFIEDRNLIAHNYWRLAKTNISGGEKLDDPEKFLKEFISKCAFWESVFNGLVCSLMEAAAKKENRLNELQLNDKQRQDIVVYERHAGKILTQRIQRIVENN